jgi:hypothetical protein
MDAMVSTKISFHTQGPERMRTTTPVHGDEHCHRSRREIKSGIISKIRQKTPNLNTFFTSTCSSRKWFVYIFKKISRKRFAAKLGFWSLRIRYPGEF